MAMPKAAVDENDLASSMKDEVGIARKVPTMEPVTEAEGLE
jgi:hypothetical protein